MRRRPDHPPRTASLALIALVLAACTPIEGAQAPTGALRVDVQVLAFTFPRPTEVLVAFETGSPSRRVALEAGAVVEAIPAFGAPVALSEGSGPRLFDGVAYVGLLDDVAPADVVGFDLRRPVEADAVGSTFVVPAAPSNVEPASGGVHANGATLIVTWTPGTGDDVWVRAAPLACDGVPQDDVDALALLLYPARVVADTGSTEVDLEYPEALESPSCTFEILVGSVGEAIDLAPEFEGPGAIAVVSIAAPIEVEVLDTSF